MSNKQQNYTTLIVLFCILLFGLAIPWFFPHLTLTVQSFWREHGNQVRLYVNNIACTLIVLQIITLRPNVTGDLTLRQIFRLGLLLPLVLAMASVPIRTFFGDYPIHDISETISNSFIAIALFAYRSQIQKLI